MNTHQYPVVAPFLVVRQDRLQGKIMKVGVYKGVEITYSILRRVFKKHAITFVHLRSVESSINVRPDIILAEQDHVTETELLRFRKELPFSRVVLTNVSPDSADVAGWLRSGVRGFILRGATYRDYREIFRVVAAANVVMPEAVAKQLCGQLNYFHSSTKTGTLQLTPAEHKVVGMVIKGMSNKEIALQLNVNTGTIKTHLHNIFQKIGCRNRSQLTAFAFENGWTNSPYALPESFRNPA